MSEPLKSCPFCGNVNVKLVLEHDKDVGRCWYVECQKCYAKSASMVECHGRQEPEEAFDQITAAVIAATIAWNRRAEPPKEEIP